MMLSLKGMQDLYLFFLLRARSALLFIGDICWKYNISPSIAIDAIWLIRNRDTCIQRHNCGYRPAPLHVLAFMRTCHCRCGKMYYLNAGYLLLLLLHRFGEGMNNTAHRQRRTNIKNRFNWRKYLINLIYLDIFLIVCAFAYFPYMWFVIARFSFFRIFLFSLRSSYVLGLPTR